MAKNTDENPVTIVGHRGDPRAAIRAETMMSNTNLACPECSHATSVPGDPKDVAPTPY